MSVNKAILIGRLGKDPELRYTPGGRAVATFSLATSEVYQNQEGQRQEATTWHNIVCWGKTAELAKEYLRKGREVYLEGRISNRSYDDKDGNKRYISEVVVQNMRFIGSRQQGEPGGAAEEADTSPAPAASTGAEDDDLPF
ncbi:MAG: single-stranded DNA-binding protein [bacterium]|nr:single-stranded DNA-binding protein [bacterium]